MDARGVHAVHHCGRPGGHSLAGPTRAVPLNKAEVAGHHNNGLRRRLGRRQPSVHHLRPGRVGPLPGPTLWLPRLVHLDTLPLPPL